MRKVIYLAIALALFWSSASFAVDFRTGQESVTTGAAEVIGDETSRVGLTVCNADTANPIYCGKSGVTSTTGLRVAAGACWTVDDKAPSGAASAEGVVACRATGGTVTAPFWETVK